MRTTVRLDDDLLRDAKKAAAARGCSLTALIEDSLRASLGRATAAKRRKPVRLRTAGGKGTQAGVDLDDTAALLDLMERGDGPV